jgi:hypothetical protein
MSDRGDYPFYPIRGGPQGLADILSKFREELDKALYPIYERLEKLESAVFREGVKRITPETAPPTEGGEGGEGGEEHPKELREYIMQIRMVNIALRGYGQLLNELGLPKDLRQAMHQIQNMVMALLRLIQFINMINLMMTGVVTGPYGWFVAGGLLSGMLAYSGKVLGGF